MRRGLRFLFVVVGLAPLVRCGGCSPNALPDVDASRPSSCRSDIECPAGTSCFFPAAETCPPTGACLENTASTCTETVCDCTGRTLDARCTTSSLVSFPIRHVGACEASATCTPSCAVCDTSAYAPRTMHAPAVTVGACSPQAISGFVDACLGAAATTTTCQAWHIANDGGACARCIFTPDSSTGWGAFVCTGSTCLSNTGGCVDLLLGTTSDEAVAGGGGSCGDRFDAQDGCFEYACGACDAADGMLQLCESSAEPWCAGWAAPTSGSGPCAGLATDAGGAAACATMDPTSLVDLFCGSGP